MLPPNETRRMMVLNGRPSSTPPFGSPTNRHRSVAVMFRLHHYLRWSGEAQSASVSVAQARCALSYPNLISFFFGTWEGNLTHRPCDITSIFDCETRTAVRVRIRGVVVRIRVNDTAIRIRTVVRPQHHTGAMPTSAFCYFPSVGQPMADNALYASTLAALTMVPLKARREPRSEFIFEEPLYAPV